MARILAISSHVVRGHVGNAAVVPALTGLGHEVWALPSIVLSNHPGHAHVAGAPVSPETFAAIFQALEDNGWLDEVDALLTGYLPDPDQITVVHDRITRMRRERGRRTLTYLCDPVLGDVPEGLYIDPAAAAAIRDKLLPLADIVTPNRFELSWLSGEPVDGVGAAFGAMERLTPPMVIATSLPAGEPDRIVNLLSVGGGTGDLSIEVARKPDVPHGTGDLMAALVLGHHLNGDSLQRAFCRAVAGIEAVLDLSVAGGELNLVATPQKWLFAAPAITRGTGPPD